MKEIPLTQGKVALVDDEDFEILSKSKWNAGKIHNTVYAFSKKNGRNEYMHRIILNAPQKGMQTDHIDGNGLNNQKSNLRVVTNRQNGQNKHIKKTSKYPGVCWHSIKKKWQAQIRIDRKIRYLGWFEIELEAATAYNVAYEVLIKGGKE